MRGKEFFEKLTDIEDEFIISANNISNKKKKIYFKYISIAASFLIIIFSLYFYNIEFLSNDESFIEFSPKDESLPMLTLDNNSSGGMGFEGYMAYDIDELINANPWNEDLDITHLPAIENTNYQNQFEILENPDYDLMREKLIETATILGMDIENLEIQDNGYTEEEKLEAMYYSSMSLDDVDIEHIESLGPEWEVVYLEDNRVYINPKGYFDIRYFFVEDENYYVMVNWISFIQIRFKNSENHISSNEYPPYDFYYNNIDNILKNYSSLLDMENPTANIHHGDYNIYAQQMFSLSFFDTSDDIITSMLNYAFNQTSFGIYDNSEVSIINKDYNDLSNIIAMYPIISIDEAQILLENGYYLTHAPEPEKIDSKYIKDVELVYRNTNSSKIHIPYYKFYVEDTEFQQGDLTTYRAFYVPAIESQYIADMPSVMDIDFN